MRSISRERWRGLYDLVLVLVSRDLRVRYRGSFLGVLWTLVQPLLMMIVLHVVFSNIFRFKVPNYPVYALTGIMFWNFFSQSITSAMNSLRGNADLIQKTTVPHAVFPIAAVASGAVNLAIALVPLFGLLLATGHALTPALLFLPVAILIATVFTLGAGLALSPLAVFFADVVELVGVLLSIMMYLTPAFYPMSIIPPKYLWLVKYNPVRSILETFRDPIFFGKIPPIQHLAVAIVVSLAALFIGVSIYRRTFDRVAYFA